MTEFLAFIGMALGFYAFVLLGVATTGPHHPAERAEYERFKMERRKRRRHI